MMISDYVTPELSSNVKENLWYYFVNLDLSLGYLLKSLELITNVYIAWNFTQSIQVLLKMEVIIFYHNAFSTTIKTLTV